MTDKTSRKSANVAKKAANRVAPKGAEPRKPVLISGGNRQKVQGLRTVLAGG